MRIIYNEDLNKRIIPYVDKLIKNKKKLDKETVQCLITGKRWISCIDLSDSLGAVAVSTGVIADIE